MFYVGLPKDTAALALSPKINIISQWYRPKYRTNCLLNNDTKDRLITGKKEGCERGGPIYMYAYI